MDKQVKLQRVPRLLLGLVLSCLAACGESSKSGGNGLVNICSSGSASQDYPQSANIRCLYRLNAGSLEPQAADSTRTVAFQGNTLYTLSTYVQQWDVATGEERLPVDAEIKHTSFDNDEALHFSQEYGYVGFSDGGRVYTDIIVSDPLFESRGTGYKKVAYVDGWDMFAGYDKEALYFYDRATGKFISEQAIKQGISRVVGGQNSYATALSDQRIVIWPTAEDGEGLVLAGHTGEIIKLVYSDDETLFASADSTGTIILWDLATGEEIRRFQVEVSAAVPAVAIAFSPDNQLLVTNGSGPTVTMWSLASGEPVAELSMIKFGILDLDISPDGSKLAVGSAFGGKYDQNAPTNSSEDRLDPNRLESGPAFVFDISNVKP
ncbi:MAG: WD40 repeat domain-containing protein [Cyanobacteria bacterium P01_A01_bin.137]